jgi:hypothetical protein
VGAVLGIILGIVALKRADSDPAGYGGKGMAITGIVLSGASVIVIPFVAGIVAAIAIPSLLRARVAANEAKAIGDVRTFAASELFYREMNKGYYDEPQCLAAPAACVPSYSGPRSLFDSKVTSLKPGAGYRASFHAGHAIGSEVAKAKGCSPTSLESWVYLSTPLEQGRTGIRTFCADSSGALCYAMEPIDPVGGECPAAPACEPLKRFR